MTIFLDMMILFHDDSRAISIKVFVLHPEASSKLNDGDKMNISL